MKLKLLLNALLCMTGVFIISAQDGYARDKSTDIDFSQFTLPDFSTTSTQSSKSKKTTPSSSDIDFSQFMLPDFSTTSTQPSKSKKTKATTSSSPSSTDNPYLTPFVDAGKGTFIQMYDQDASAGTGFGLRDVYLPHANLTWLGNSEFQVADLSIKPKKGLYRGSSFNADQTRAMSIFATATAGYDVLRRDYLFMKGNLPSKYSQSVTGFYATWKKDLPPIMIYQNAGTDQNAYYTRYTGKRGEVVREGRFFNFNSETELFKKIYTANSSEIVGHELWGHGHLDEIHPNFLEESSLELGGFHEGNADGQSLLINIAISGNQRQSFIAQTGGDFHKSGNLYEDLAEEFGLAISKQSYLRNLDIDAILGKTEQEVHDIGCVWASGIYDILGSAYPVAQKSLISKMEEEQILLHTASYLRRLNNLAIILAKDSSPRMTDFASTMFMIAQERTALTGIPEIDGLPWQDYLRTEFTRRNIPVLGGSGKAQLYNIGFSKEKVSLCGTTHKHLKHQLKTKGALTY